MYVISRRIRAGEKVLYGGEIFFLRVKGEEGDEDEAFVVFAAPREIPFHAGEKVLPVLFDAVRLETVAQRPVVDERQTFFRPEDKFFVREQGDDRELDKRRLVIFVRKEKDIRKIGLQFFGDFAHVRRADAEKVGFGRADDLFLKGGELPVPIRFENA